jgi:hypothetical protein
MIGAPAGAIMTTAGGVRVRSNTFLQPFTPRTTGFHSLAAPDFISPGAAFAGSSPKMCRSADAPGSGVAYRGDEAGRSSVR